MKVKQEDGTEIEVVPVEEVEQKINQVKDDLKKEYDTKITETNTALETLKTEKADLEAKIAGNKEGEDSPNFKVLKEALNKKDEEIKNLGSKITSIEQQRIEDYKTKFISTYSRGDKEVEKKILHHFNETLKSVDAVTPEQIEAKLQSAFKLSVDIQKPNQLQKVIQGNNGIGFDVNNGGGAPEFTPQEKALGAKFGLTEEDYKKYGPKI